MSISVALSKKCKTIIYESFIDIKKKKMNSLDQELDIQNKMKYIFRNGCPVLKFLPIYSKIISLISIYWS